MKNDIVGTFAILIVGVVFLFFAKNYDDGSMWLLSPNLLSLSESMSMNSRQVDQTVTDAAEASTSAITPSATVTAVIADSSGNENDSNLPFVANILPSSRGEEKKNEVNFEEVKPEKTTPPIPYVLNRFQKNPDSEETLQKLVGGVFMWPDKIEKHQTMSYKYMADAQGLTIEIQYDASGKSQNQKRKLISSALGKIGFKQVNKKLLTCQTSEMVGFSECLDYYQRGAEKCISWLVMTPINAKDIQKINQRMVQIKVWCSMETK